MATNKNENQMEENVAGALAYLIGFISGIYFLITDKRPSVKFHAGQSIVLSVLYSGIMMVLPWQMRIGFGGLLGLAAFVVWLMAMYKAYQGQKFEIPLVSDVVRNIFK